MSDQGECGLVMSRDRQGNAEI